MPCSLSIAETVQFVPPSRGSSTVSPSSKWCCWAGKRNVHSCERARRLTVRRSNGSFPSCSRQPIASPSSTSSSSVIFCRAKYHQYAGRASRLWYSSSRASSSRQSPSPRSRSASRSSVVSVVSSSDGVYGSGGSQERDLDCVLRGGLVALREQPVAQLERGEAVLLVVGGDRVEASLVAVVEPALELDHGLVPGADVGLALEEELLDVLQPVRLDAGAQALADDLEQVDEHLAAQELVDLFLAGRVACPSGGRASRARRPRSGRRAGRDTRGGAR